MVYGLRQLEQICASGGQVLFDVYDSKEVQESPDKECVKLIYFPAKQCNNGSRKTIILAAGGAYGSVCSMVESFPVAARLAELGVDAFCLNYRVADGKALFPRPMEDMGAACQFLMQHQDTLESIWNIMQLELFGRWTSGSLLGHTRTGVCCISGVKTGYHPPGISYD